MALPAIEEMENKRIITKAEALKYKGKLVYYLCSSDIDKSGRGFYFVRSIYVDKVEGNQFIDQNYNSVYYRDILYIKEKEEK